MKSDKTYLQHILEMVGWVEAATDSSKAAFLTSPLHQDAVLRNLHTITETTQRLSAGLKPSHPDVEGQSLLLLETSLSMITLELTGLLLAYVHRITGWSPGSVGFF